MVSSMASLLDGAAEYRPELSIPLHHAMSMPCESSPPGMGMSSTYTTLTPLQPLPPISTVSDKFHHPHAHPHAHHHHHHQRLSGNVSGSFALMRDERGLPAVNNLYGPYKEMPGMGQSLSPLGNGLGPLHNAQQGLHGYGPPGHEKMLSPNFDAHAAMLARGDQHLSRGLGTPPAMMPHLNGMHHPAHPGHPPPHGPALPAGRERPPSSSSGSQVSGSGQLEEINTKEVAQRITAELKRYSIPQAIFAQRVLCRSQGTLSDLLRNPKPWSKLKSGRETFRRMWKWLQEPEFQRMSALRLAAEGCRTQREEGVPAVTELRERKIRLSTKKTRSWRETVGLRAAFSERCRNPCLPKRRRGVGNVLPLREGWFGRAKRSSPITADLLWQNGINSLCHAPPLRARAGFLEERRQRAFIGIAKIRRGACVCSRRNCAGEGALAARPDNGIICIFIRIVSCYIMILYTAEYLT
ncbi:one cut domain family member 2 isoform X1 [Balearica regulorum gibbericeps]|uniref:one cut domain family member 2 isoform X1 n=1 Tax=Balearica regulorum gibbericeps TaxID=100784 RepID=UPI003F60304C